VGRQEERYRAAVRALREAMDLLDADESQPSPRVALYQAGKSWLVWAWHGESYPGALAIIPAPDCDETEEEPGITAAVLRDIPMPEISEDSRAIRPLAANKRAHAAIRRFADYLACGRRDDLYYVLLSDVYASITARGDQNPAAALARLAEVDGATMRTHIDDACSRGLLTDPREPSGGRLTDEARKLLAEAEG
jgi:hypothetical protein